MYAEHVNDSPKQVYTAEDICSLFNVPISRNLVAMALESLYKQSRFDKKLIVAVGGRKGPTKSYAIADYGVQIVEVALRRASSDLSYYREHGDGALDAVAGLQGIFWTKDELVENEDWVPINFDKSAPEYIEAVDAVEEAIDVASKSNEFEAAHPKEKVGILESLQEGLNWIKNKAPTRAQLKHQLVDPLTWISRTFGNSILGEAAKKAAQKILDLIGSLFF